MIRAFIALAFLLTSAPAWAVVNGQWSGYVISGSGFSQGSATWKIPTVTYDGLPTPNGFEAVGIWVGIGGVGVSDLIQVGTSSRVTTAGVPSYFGWYATCPDCTQLNIPQSFSPGDVITASLQCIAACSPSTTQTWRLTMTNVTEVWTWTLDLSYQSSLSSVEWIAESPSVGAQNNPLAKYDAINFSGLVANGLNPLLSDTKGTPYQMNNPWGQTSMFSAPVHGDNFSLCWGLAPNYTSCIVPGTIVPGHRGFMR